MANILVNVEDARMPMKTVANTLPLWQLQRTEMESGSKNWFEKLG